MKRVTITEIGGIKDGTNHYQGPVLDDDGKEITPGDTLTHERGEYWQELGWAKCAETGDTGKRKTGVSKLQPADVIQPVA